MAKGDIKAALIQVAADTLLDVQPPAGEVWMITTILTKGDGVNAGFAGLRIAAGTAGYFLRPSNGIGEGDLDVATMRDGKIFVDNTTYFYISNESAAAEYLAYSGVQWQ